MVSAKLKITEPKGLHMRPAKDISQIATDYGCKVSIVSGDAVVNAKSLLNILGVGVKCGTVIEVICEGPDEEAALQAIVEILSKKKES